MVRKAHKFYSLNNDPRTSTPGVIPKPEDGTGILGACYLPVFESEEKAHGLPSLSCVDYEGPEEGWDTKGARTRK